MQADVLPRVETAELVTNGAFVRDAILPLNPNAPEQLPLWQERVRLDEGFYQSLIEHPLPIERPPFGRFLTDPWRSTCTSGSPTASMCYRAR